MTLTPFTTVRQRLRVGLLMLIAAAIACSDDSNPVQPTNPVATVAVTTPLAAISVGATTTLVATPRDAKGFPLAGRRVTWESSSTAIATVTAGGVVTAIAPGTVTIWATSEGRVGGADITVTQVPVASVELSQLTMVLAEGQTHQLTATPRDAAGDPVSGRAVAWLSDAPAVATVSAAGVVTALAPGYATITVTIEGRSAWATVTVMTPTYQYDLVYEHGYGSGNAIYSIALDGSMPVRLPLMMPVAGGFFLNPAPSPDGTKLAFVVAWYVMSGSGFDQIDGDIYVAERDGSAVRRLTTAAGLEDQPAWSPDGTKILYRARRVSAGNSIGSDIWVINADGVGPANLTPEAGRVGTVSLSPEWSVDGSRIAYASNADSYPFTRIWTMRPDGSDKRRITPGGPGIVNDETAPTWSPDGRRIAFRRITGVPAVSDIVIADVAGGTEATIAIPGEQYAPSWLPDAWLLAFASDHAGGSFDLFTVRPDGTQLTRRTATAVEERNPRWMRRR